MASSRDTRCISAAFDFLNTTDFCQRCQPGDHRPCLDSDSDMTDSACDLMGMKPSQSDTALLQYQENGGREERRVVCLCQEREASCDLHDGGGGHRDGDFLQDYIDRHAVEKQEAGDSGGRDEAETTENNIDAATEALPIKDKFEVVSKNHMKANNLQSSPNTNCVMGGEGRREGSPAACHTHGDSARESRTAPPPSQDGEDEGVVMRPNRHLLNRRSTDTGFISSAFEFLPSTDSVFLPSKGGTTHRTGKSPTSASMAGVEECEPGDGDDDHGSEPCGAEVGEEEKGGGLSNGGSVKGPDSDNVGEDGTNSTKDNGMDCTSDDEGGAVRLRRRPISKQESVMEDEGSGDSSDDDAGVYAESFRRSNWVRIDESGQLELAFPASRSSAASRSSGNSRSSSWSTDMTDSGQTPGPKLSSDESAPAPSQSPSPRLYRFHKRSDSTSTTLSEKEFKKEYVTRRKCLIQRQNSSKEYHRFSANVYEEEKTVTLEKAAGEQGFGLHILDSQPAYITMVDPGSAADRAGVEEGQILVSVNGTNVLSSSHDDIVALIIDSPSMIQVAIATSDFQPSRDLQAALMEGYMQKLGGSSSVIMRRWKKRFFVLRQDSCLYYYKQKEDSDPLGAIPLVGYTFSRHLDSGRDFCFKAEKYGARTYYFMTEGRDIMTEWVGALSDAAARSRSRKESFVSVSSHNVGLPALDIRRPECTGYLLKVGNRHKTWHRRYCVLKDACLYYYKNVNSLSALGVAHLHGYKVDPSIAISKRHAFALVPPLDSLRTFQFSADNDTDRQRWVQAMIRSIQRWIQIDNDC